MSKFSRYTSAQLLFASQDIRDTLQIWRDDRHNPYVRKLELELDEVRDEMLRRRRKTS
jgi:hypothetical protein